MPRALVIWQTWYFGHDPLPAEKWACVRPYLCVYTAYSWNRLFFCSSAISLLLLWCSECQFISVSLTSLNSKGTVHCNPSGSHVIETDICWRGAWAAFILGTCPSPSRVKRTDKASLISPTLAGELADPWVIRPRNHWVKETGVCAGGQWAGSVLSAVIHSPAGLWQSLFIPRRSSVCRTVHRLLLSE